MKVFAILALATVTLADTSYSPSYSPAPAYAPAALAYSPAPAYATATPVYNKPAYSKPSYNTYQDNYDNQPAYYQFAYEVNDNYGPHFSASETRNTDKTNGDYSVDLPDGRIQHVNYYVDGYSGYVADVTYSGNANYAAPSYSAPAYSKPTYQAPAYQSPAYKAAPAYQAPAYQAPAYQAPAYKPAPYSG